MSDLIGTVHKLPEPEVPEPEGWIRVRFEPLDWMWHVTEPPILPLDELSERMVGILPSSNPTRLVHIGPAPKVPVEAIRKLIECGEWMSERTAPAEVRSWLAELEKGGAK